MGAGKEVDEIAGGENGMGMGIVSELGNRASEK